MYDSRLLRSLVSLALDEDLSFGDLTSEACPADKIGVATVVSKQAMVVCGAPVTPLILRELTDNFSVKLLVEDGEVVEAGTSLAQIFGPVRSLLMAERTILNFVQKLSGIATHVRSVVEEADGFVLCDTRKTTPGWRVPEKYAVMIGGARNHRMHLGDMVMVKNNHIDIVGSDLETYLSVIRSRIPFYTPIQIEVRSRDELMEILPFKPNAVLLDNMTNEQMAECVTEIRSYDSSIMIEASGMIGPERFSALTAIGVDTASTSLLIHGAGTVDISMNLRLSGE